MEILLLLIPLIVLTGIAVTMLVVTERSKLEGQKVLSEEASTGLYRDFFTIRTNMQGSARVWIYGANVVLFDTYLRLIGRRPFGQSFDIRIDFDSILEVRSTAAPWRSLEIIVSVGRDSKYVQIVSGRVSELARALESRLSKDR